MCLIPSQAHIFMQFPPSRKNKYSEYYSSNNLVDYNIMAPLNTYGYTFPCKGFKKGPSTVTFSSNTIKVILEGNATHGGGHCQFGITYNDNEFLVLKTIIRSCLIDSMTYEFDLPNNIPDGQVTVFWTWVNAIGNREYYMECADITISNNAISNDEPLIGKELIIANINGYQVIPEFPHPEMYDGHELFLNAQTFYIYPPVTSNPPTPSIINDPIPPTPNPPLPPAPNLPPVNDKCTNIGELKCNGNGFNTCIYGNWVFRNCAPGTICKQLPDTIVCEFE
jgi:hypothetical protein